EPSVALFGVEAAGHGVHTHHHAATLSAGRIGVLHGSKSYVLCDDSGQIQEAHSISAGLDYPGVGPEHAHLKDTGRATYLTATDPAPRRAFSLPAKAEGLCAALEPPPRSAGVADTAQRPPAGPPRPVNLVVCVSGRGDKALATLLDRLAGGGAS